MDVLLYHVDVSCGCIDLSLWGVPISCSVYRCVIVSCALMCHFVVWDVSFRVYECQCVVCLCRIV